MKMTVKRGDIVLIRNCFDEESHLMKGTRPYIVISNESNNEHSGTVNVIPLTGNISRKKTKLPMHVKIDGFGLSKPSVVLAEQVGCVDKSRIIKRIGFVDDERVMLEIGKRIKNQLGLSKFKNVS